MENGTTATLKNREEIALVAKLPQVADVRGPVIMHSQRLNRCDYALAHRFRGMRATHDLPALPLSPLPRSSSVPAYAPVPALDVLTLWRLHHVCRDWQRPGHHPRTEPSSTLLAELTRVDSIGLTDVRYQTLAFEVLPRDSYFLFDNLLLTTFSCLSCFS